MKTFNTLRLATLLIATGVHLTLANAQNSPQNSPAACPRATEVTALHLYGAWQARWEGVDAPGTLMLGRNPDHPDSLRGSIRRGQVQTLVAGDVDQGEFTLEESADGRTISATWTGVVVADGCGKEIRGVWTAAADKKERSFVLRKLPGWQ
jgi:hypothetical protein